MDEEAIEIATAAASFLAAQPAMAFNWFVAYDRVVEGREKITMLRSGSNAMVRGAGVVSRVENADGVRDYYFDGETFTMSAPEEGFYASAAFKGDLEGLIDALSARTRTQIPIWEVMSASVDDDPLKGVEGAAYLGVVRVAGRPAHHLAFTEYDEDWQIWISTDEERPVPLMIVSTDPYQQGWPQYTAYLSDWSFEPVDAALFTYVPKEDEVRASFPSLTETARERARATETDETDKAPAQ